MADSKTKKKSKDKSGKSLADQFSWQTSGGRRTGPARITYAELRQLSYSNNLVRVCINSLKHAAARMPYVVRPKNEERTEELKDYVEYVKNLLAHPNANDETFRSWVSKIAEDILVLDMGVSEKVRNPKGYVVEMYTVDGSTIKPCIDEYGLYKDPAFKQYIDSGATEPDATFELDELLIFQINPQGQINTTGYGRSPVESIAQTVVASLQAAIYNNSIFDEQKMPPYIANMPGVPTEELTAFKLAFESELAGKPWKGAFTNAQGLDVKPLRPTNQEMQFYELNLWLARIIFAAFEVAPQDFGFTMDINRATAEVQERISKSRGLTNLLDVIAEEINNDLISDLAEVDPKFCEIEFAWDSIDKLDAKTQAEIDQIYVEIGKVTPDELRVRDGMKPMDVEEKEEIEEKEPILGKSTYKEFDKWMNLYK